MKRAAITLVTLAVGSLLCVQCVQTERWVTRWRAERLLADFHSLELNKTTWADAQKLMTRWGAFGHYDGVCTSEMCAYQIRVFGPIAHLLQRINLSLSEKWPEHYSGDRLRHIYFDGLHGGYNMLTVRFLVQNGFIRRSTIAVMVAGPDATKDNDRSGYVLVHVAQSSDALDDERPFLPYTPGSKEQLAAHPEYKVGRPNGLYDADMAEVTFTPYIDPKELRRLTAYDLSCMTRLSPCRVRADLLPASSAWNGTELISDDGAASQSTKVPHGCDVAVYALARDAGSIVVVDAISTETIKGSASTYEQAVIKVVAVLKGKGPWSGAAPYFIEPYSGDMRSGGLLPDHVEPGRRYILFFRWNEELPVPPTEYCGIIRDSTKARVEIRKGIARNDAITTHYGLGSLFW